MNNESDRVFLAIATSLHSVGLTRELSQNTKRTCYIAKAQGQASERRSEHKWPPKQTEPQIAHRAPITRHISRFTKR